MSNKRYVAFVSYNHSDRRWAKWVHRAVESYRTPSRLRRPDALSLPPSGRLTPVFLDREELSTSSSLAGSVRIALEQSHYLIVVCSPRSAASRWVNEEIRLFKQMGRSDRVLCLIVEGEPNASAKGDSANECFPPALLDRTRSDMAVDAEPLAADVRPGMDSPRLARLKIVAGILQVDLDDLRRREQARRYRQLTAIATAAVIGCITLAGLSTMALISRNEADRQRKIAEERSLTARRTAQFMKSLFEVSDPGEARGNSVTAREILDRGVRQIAAGLRDEPVVRADLMTTLGEVYTNLGLYKDGAQMVEGAHEVPGQPKESRVRQAVVLGEIAFLNGEYDSARAHQDEALAELRSAERPDREMLIRALTGRGEALTALEQYSEAERSLTDALALQGNTEDGARARILEGLADAAFFKDDLDAADARYREALAVRLRISGENHPKVSSALTSLGSIAYTRGNSKLAAEMYERALAIDRKVLGERHPETSVTMNNLARVYLEDRQFAKSAALLERSREILSAQVEETHDDMAFIFSNLALARAGLGDDAAAESLFDKGLRAAVMHKHRLHGPILTDLADLKCRTGRYTEGLRLLDEARSLVTARYPDEPWRAALIDNVRAGCFTGMRQLADADRLIVASTPLLLDKWGANGLYGHDALQRAIRLYTLAHNNEKLAEYRELARR